MIVGGAVHMARTLVYPVTKAAMQLVAVLGRGGVFGWMLVVNRRT